MKCKVCGAESGKYPLCYACNLKKEKGIIIKCPKCQNWHYADQNCDDNNQENTKEEFLYKAKNALITDTEKEFYKAIISSLTEEYKVFPQINLAAFIERTDNSKFRNELFRNVDFLITNASYEPKIVVEINDQTHLNKERQERDEKVKNICEEAGIPIIRLWTSYGVNYEYIKKTIDETLSSLPIERVRHFDQDKNKTPQQTDENISNNNENKQQPKGGCYIATCVYGSYNSPEVLVLRKYRDNILAKTLVGRIFIKIYYKISPLLVKCFGKTNWFKKFWKRNLDKMVNKLRQKF